MKYMNLREPDRQLLLKLHDFIYLDRAFIETYVMPYGGEHSIYRRLRDLEKAGYIKSFLLPVNFDDHRPSKVFTLDKLGVDTVQELRGISHWQAKWSTMPPPWYLHQLMLADSVMAFELQAEAAGLKFKEWVSEARAFYEFPTQANGPKQKSLLRPDGIMVIGNDKVNMGIMVEMERSYTTREKTLRKIDQYNEFFSRLDELAGPYDRKVGFNEPIAGYQILFIGGTEAKAEKLLRDLEKESCEVPVLVASKDAIHAKAFGEIYTDSRTGELRTL